MAFCRTNDSGIRRKRSPAAAVFLLLLYVLPAQPPALPHFSAAYLAWITLGAVFQVAATAALLLAIACSAVAGVWMEHRSISEPPDLGQLLAHVLLLHDLLDQEALSAGVWYVAIDFQLFALAVLLLWLPHRLAARFPAQAGALRLLAALLVAGMTLASLFGFNRDDLWDETALYFFGAFGLGILCSWALRLPRPALWLGLLTLAAAAALAVDFRERIAVATGVMLFLAVAARSGLLHTLPLPAAVSRLAQISYSVFLVHFPLSLLVNAVVSGFFPANPVVNALGMLLALAVSIAAAQLHHRLAVDARQRLGGFSIWQGEGFCHAWRE